MNAARLLLTVLLAWQAACAVAQSDASTVASPASPAFEVRETPPAPSPAELAQREIDAQRAKVEAAYDQDRAACYQRFWVNPCVREAKARRRVLMEDLRRQEIVLNDALRRERGAEQLQRIDERFTDEAIEQARQRREEALQDSLSREQQAEQKRLERESMTAPEPRGPSTSNLPTDAQKNSAREAFDEKQRAAAETKARVDKALADKAAKPVVPGAPPTALPTPR
jgi:colicin import membrane protein